MNTIYGELIDRKNVRQNLSALRQKLKESDPAQRRELAARIAGCEDLFWSFLADSDAKTRRNAALLFGDLCYAPAIPRLCEAYGREETLFVRSAYPEALAGYPADLLCGALASDSFQARLEQLEAAVLAGTVDGEALGENRKHVEEELRALRRLMARWEGIPRHTFVMPGGDCRVLLVANRLHREVVRRLAENVLGRKGKAELHPLGVRVQTDDIEALFQIRAFRELLFLNPGAGSALVPNDPAKAAAQLAGWLADLCKSCHEGAERFYFRVECRSAMTLEQRSSFTRRLGAELEKCSAGVLVNSPGDYEVELRLVMNREGLFFPCVKFAALPDHRFDYRRNAISASIHPSTAALIMELARPYLKDGAQLLDPFCGVGTMLIERAAAVHAGDMYATDIFGDAIVYGRENARLAGADIHFIHRDFSDFRHEYPFDEIITNMPTRGKKTREELDRLYALFFARASELLKRGAVILMYTNETGFVKKQLRLHREFVLMQETLMQEKGEYYLLVIGFV